jgi:hypothetical protein
MIIIVEPFDTFQRYELSEWLFFNRNGAAFQTIYHDHARAPVQLRAGAVRRGNSAGNSDAMEAPAGGCSLTLVKEGFSPHQLAAEALMQGQLRLQVLCC